MNILIILLLLIITILIVYNQFFSKKIDDISDKKEQELLKENLARLKIENENASQKTGELNSEIVSLNKEKNEVQGKSKQLFVTLTSFQEKCKNLEEQNSELSKKVIQFESKKNEQERELEKSLSEMNKTREKFSEEQVRIRREDEERLQEEEENRNRIWNDHEVSALAKMSEICKKPELNFNFYANTDLPDSFDGKLKPDFMIEFLGQYIIFDAKMSRSADLQTYINAQIKSTVKKIKDSKNKDEIYNTVFFIVPTIAFETLKTTSFFEGGYSFFIISTESVESILHSYKRIQEYDLAETFDPKDRENIVNLISSYDQFISKQNAVNILSSIEGVKIMQMKNNLEESIQTDVEIKKKKLRIENFKPTDLKRLISNPEEQIEEMKKLVVPKKSEISQKELKDANDSFEF